MNRLGILRRHQPTLVALTTAGLVMMAPSAAFAGEADLVLPDLTTSKFLGGFVSGYWLLMMGLLICAGGLAFGLVFYRQLKALPVHRTMREVSDLIYATCQTYLLTQGKFIMVLWVFIATVIVAYFGFLSTEATGPDAITISRTAKVGVILLFSLIGIAGSYAVAWFGIRINTFANSRTCMASLRGSQYLCSSIPRKSAATSRLSSA